MTVDFASRLGRPLSSAMMRMLGGIREHGDPWARIRGAAQHGASEQTMRVLQGCGLISFDPKARRHWSLTRDGRASLDAGRFTSARAT